MKKVSAISGIFFPVVFVLAIVILTGCSNREVVSTCLKGHEFGFWGGLWHGIIAPVDLIFMLFRDDVSVYASNTNGAWYAFGFVLGSGGWGFLGGHRASRKWKKSR